MSRTFGICGVRPVSLLVVVLGIVAVLSVLLPAMQAAREAARRVRCNDNLRAIGLALQNYHDTYKMFPMGATHAGPNPGGVPPIEAALGPSWWYAIIPFMESRRLPDIPPTQRPGGPTTYEFCADDINGVGVPIGSFLPEYMRCPSSPLPVMERRDGPICLPTYVGIAGGCDIDERAWEYQISEPAPSDSGWGPKSTRLYHNKFKGTGAAAGGVVTSSGLLPPCEHVSLRDCGDGSSNTMIVSEQSGWLLDRDPSIDTKYHGDAGWTVGGTGPGGGWLSGTRRVDPVPQIDEAGGPPATWGADCWNITTVRYPYTLRRVMGVTPLPGCSENHGINNPLQPAHPGGVLVGMADGSIHFLSDLSHLTYLLRFAIRNDAPIDNPY